MPRHPKLQPQQPREKFTTIGKQRNASDVQQFIIMWSKLLVEDKTAQTNQWPLYKVLASGALRPVGLATLESQINALLLRRTVSDSFGQDQTLDAFLNEAPQKIVTRIF